jgi:hypothetical protein
MCPILVEDRVRDQPRARVRISISMSVLPVSSVLPPTWAMAERGEAGVGVSEFSGVWAYNPFMEFGQTGVAGHEQSPPHQRAHDGKLINCWGKVSKAQACGHVTGAHGFCFASDPPESPALQNS